MIYKIIYIYYVACFFIAFLLKMHIILINKKSIIRPYPGRSMSYSLNFSTIGATLPLHCIKLNLKEVNVMSHDDVKRQRVFPQ